MTAKFDLDLKFGEEGEQWLKLLGTDTTKIEVKTDRLWYKTGNIYFLNMNVIINLLGYQ